MQFQELSLLKSSIKSISNFKFEFSKLLIISKVRFLIVFDPLKTGMTIDISIYFYLLQHLIRQAKYEIILEFIK